MLDYNNLELVRSGRVAENDPVDITAYHMIQLISATFLLCIIRNMRTDEFYRIIIVIVVNCSEFSTSIYSANLTIHNAVV